MTRFLTVKDNFIEELKKAKSGLPSSISYLIHEVPNIPLVKDGEEYGILVIGGSICKTATAVIKNGKVELLSKKQVDLPTFGTKETFFSFIDQQIKDENLLAVSFAFPMDPIFENGRLDGIVLRGSKEHAFTGLVGQKLGQCIEEYFRNRGRTLQVTVANDTICLALAGLSEFQPSNLAAGIMGTGVNLALFEDKTHVVNLESAGFDKFEKSDAVLKIDHESSSPGSSLFEKETAGAYLYMHFNYLIEKEVIEHAKLTSTHELKLLALSEKSPSQEAAYSLIEHSAGMFAAQIAGIADFLNRDMIFIMDGSFFWEHDLYKDLVGNFTQELTDKKISFHFIPDASILGAGYLVI